MQKSNMLRLIKETNLIPLKISHNVIKDNYVVLEYMLPEGSNKLFRIDHGSGSKQECQAKVQQLVKANPYYLHVN